DRRALIEEAACRMQTLQRFQMSSANEFEEIVRARHPAVPTEELMRRVTDVRSQSSYFRREGDIFTFAHKSFMEYFVARRVAKALRDGQTSVIPLTDVIVGFLGGLLSDLAPIRQHCDDGMVLVPKGPFAFGNEEQGNLQIANLDEDFWIDKHPVTN